MGAFPRVAAKVYRTLLALISPAILRLVAGKTGATIGANVLEERISWT